ncbi:MAG: hypothetical protein M3Q34_01320 [bacterium]|nr:hypothetical protein [bacterium]
MTQEELQKKIAEFYVKLSPKTQSVFGSQTWLETLRKINTRHSLTEEQIQALGTETTLVLLGITNRDEYEKVLNEELKLPKEKFENILEEINTFVLNPIITELSENYNKNLNNIKDKPVKETPKEEVKEKAEETLEKKVESQNLVTQKPDPRFVNLPANVKSIVNASNYSAKIYVLGRDNGLTLAQITNLEEIVTDTILGTTSQEMFEVRAMSISGLDKDKLKFLINEINDKVLKLIRTQVLSLENNEKKDRPDISSDREGVVPSVLPTQANPVEEKVATPTITPVNNPVSAQVEEVVQKPQQVPVTKNIPQGVPLANATSPVTNSVNSITLKKLGGSVRSAGTVTEYSLNNISKQEDGNMKGGSATDSQKVDPYRMPIE